MSVLTADKAERDGQIGKRSCPSRVVQVSGLFFFFFSFFPGIHPTGTRTRHPPGRSVSKRRDQAGVPSGSGFCPMAGGKSLDHVVAGSEAPHWPNPELGKAPQISSQMVEVHGVLVDVCLYEVIQRARKDGNNNKQPSYMECSILAVCPFEAAQSFLLLL